MLHGTTIAVLPLLARRRRTRVRKLHWPALEGGLLLSGSTSRTRDPVWLPKLAAQRGAVTCRSCLRVMRILLSVERNASSVAAGD